LVSGADAAIARDGVTQRRMDSIVSVFRLSR
jgi:hypothetical protein